MRNGRKRASRQTKLKTAAGVCNRTETSKAFYTYYLNQDHTITEISREDLTKTKKNCYE